MNVRRTSTLRDVARASGASLATVSRVLSNSRSVTEETRKHVLAVAKELGYRKRPKRGVRSPKRTKSIALVVPDLSNPYFPILIKGVENIAKIHEYSLILCDSENDPATERRLVEALVERPTDGLLLVPSSAGGEHIERLLDDEFPLVFVDRRIDSPRINSICAANDEGSYQATKYLLSLGHRSFLYVGGPKELSTERERFEGYRRALLESNIPPGDSHTIRCDYSWSTAQRAIGELLDARFDFTAIVASNDLMAFGAIQALGDRAIGVPDRASVIGFDDIPFASLLSLTTVSQHPYEMGSMAMTTLIDLINGRVKSPRTARLMPSLIIRSSCRRLP